jgi:hypothetical protein
MNYSRRFQFALLATLVSCAAISDTDRFEQERRQLSNSFRESTCENAEPLGSSIRKSPYDETISVKTERLRCVGGVVENQIVDLPQPKEFRTLVSVESRLGFRKIPIHVEQDFVEVRELFGEPDRSKGCSYFYILDESYSELEVVEKEGRVWQLIWRSPLD